MIANDGVDDLTMVLAELEIRNSIVRLASATDDGDLADYALLLATDVVFEMAGTVIDGVPAVLAGMADRRTAGMTGPGSKTRHVISNIEVAISGADCASVRAAWQFFTDTGDKPTLFLIGRYEDRWVLSVAAWRLAQRRIVMG